MLERKGQQMSTTSWLLGHHRVNRCCQGRREEEEDHQMALKADSSQESPLVFQNDRKNPDEECRGKSFGGLAGGVGESVYGVQQCVSGR